MKDFITKKDLAGAEYSFIIHDNGREPFKVVASAKGLQVFRSKPWNDNLKKYEHESAPFKTFTEFEGFWPGRDFTIENDKFRGNTILVKLDDSEYVFLGGRILAFSTGNDVIGHYESPIGNSDVPYPIAFGKTSIYMMNEMLAAPKEDFSRAYGVGDANNITEEFRGTLTATDGWQRDLKVRPIPNLRSIHDRFNPDISWMSMKLLNDTAARYGLRGEWRNTEREN